MSENREFRIESVGELNATPERVWEAINNATQAWMFPTDQWPAEYPVKDYPSHVISRMDGPDGWFNQLENTIEALPDGRSRLHYVHSGIFTDNWEGQYDGASKHTVFYQHSLNQYLTYFDGKPVVFTDVQGPEGSGVQGSFDALKSAFGISSATAGDAVSVDVPGVGVLEGELDFSNQWFFGIRTADAMYRFFGRDSFGSVVGLTVHDFSGSGDSEATASSWSAYFHGLYA
ncbi:SRPBCC domain-containing protein [Arthrobacter sp. NPDC090010]|uniref:SRPBCC domain-containing protein n=1 Tax=Arthrobacter sp. NPDC090010 TaxID=3363942 RepID=UPI00381ABE31